MVEKVLTHYEELGEDPGYQGVFEQQYCDAFAAYHGGGHADAVATGTAAVFIAIAALQLPKGAEVLVSPITDPGTLSAIIMNGLVPVMVDSAPGHFNVGLAQVEERMTDKTGAFVLVHSAGQPVSDIVEIVALCRSKGVKVVEDSSQSHGATVNGVCVGNFGDIAAFSTMYRKNSVTGGSGGVVYCHDHDLFALALAYADRGKPRHIDGFDDRNPNQFLFPAMNFHTDEISCAIGIASISRLDETIQKRLRVAKSLAAQLNVEDHGCNMNQWGDGDSPFILPVHVDVDRITCSKTEFAEAVREEGIGLNPHYQYLVCDWPWLKPYLGDDFDCRNARRTIDQSFVLYVNESYGPTEVDDTLGAIGKVYEYYAR